MLVKPGLPLSLLVTLFHGPSFPGDQDQDGQGNRPAVGAWQ